LNWGYQLHISASGLAGIQKDLCSVNKLSRPTADCRGVFFWNLAAYSVITDVSQILSVDQPSMKFRIQSSGLCEFSTESGDHGGIAAVRLPNVRQERGGHIELSVISS
jgi:hypothetical protein